MPLALFQNIGPWEVLIVVFVLLIVFGPKRLPQLGRSLGRGIRELKDGLTARHDREDKELAAAETAETAKDEEAA